MVVVEVVMLAVVTCTVVVFGADTVVLLRTVASCSLVVVVRGVSDITVLLSFEGALTVNSPATAAGWGVACVITGQSVTPASFFVLVLPFVIRSSGFSVRCPSVDKSTAVGDISSEVTVCAGGRYWACPFSYVALGGKACSFIVGSFPDPKPCKSAGSPLSVVTAIDSLNCKVG